MIRLQRISTADGFLYEYMEQLITAAFPPEEHRPLEELRLYTDSRPHFYNNIIFHHDTPVGFITYWDFGKFYYVEHFAVDPAQRNGGHGKNVLNHLCQLLQHPIVLEVEMPEEELLKLVEIPPEEKMGDLALPCFAMAKKMHKNPMQIASELVEKLNEQKEFLGIE